MEQSEFFIEPENLAEVQCLRKITRISFIPIKFMFRVSIICKLKKDTLYRVQLEPTLI